MIAGLKVMQQTTEVIKKETKPIQTNMEHKEEFSIMDRA